MTTLTVRFDGDTRLLRADQSLTVGRRADLVIDESNRLLHRVLAEIRHVDDRWSVSNVGRTTSLVIADLNGASHAKLAPGATLAIPFDDTSISFSAGQANYQVTVHQQRGDLPTASMVPDGYESADRTLTSTTLAFNDEQFELLIALAAPRLDGPISATDLPTNRELAAMLGWSPTKLVRKLDHLCAKFGRAGVTGMVGTTSDSATDRRVRLADVAVEYGIVERRHLDS